MSIDTHPLVTVIVPTTQDRGKYNARLLEMIFAQDYPNFEVSTYAHDDLTIGGKRNWLCSKARGTIIQHADSDDFYAKDWLSKSVKALMESKADIVGLTKLYFYDENTKTPYLYDIEQHGKHTWVAGATFCYWKSFWETNKFKDINALEDNYFLMGSTRPPKIYSHDYVEGFMASIHEGNTCKKNTELGEYRRCNDEEAEVVKRRWNLL